MPEENMWEILLARHSPELLILTLTAIMMVTLIIIIPQLLRTNIRKSELVHQQRLQSLEKGLRLPDDDDRTRVAGRTALVVPMVVMLTAGVVTCFLVVCKSENLFAVSLAVWVVAGVVSLAAITGGVALIGRLAQIRSGEKQEEEGEIDESYSP